MTITFSEKDFRAIGDAVGQIRAQAMRARMADESARRAALQEIVTWANALTNLLVNGDVDGESVRESVACPHCDGVDAHRRGCPWA